MDYHQQAAALFRDIGHTYGKADTLDHLGQTHHVLGQPQQARAAWHEALDLYQAQRRAVDAERVQRQLTELDKHL